MSITAQINHQHPMDIKFVQFPGGERHVQISSHLDATVESIQIRAHILTSDDLMDYLLLEDAIIQALPQVRLDVEMPYLPYARQDRVCATGQAFSLGVMTKLLKLHPKHTLVVWDCHSAVGLELTGAHNIEPALIIQSSPELSAELQGEHSVLICPDKGALPRCTAIAADLNVKRVVRCEKIRDPVTGHILRTEVLADDLNGVTAVITDDICDGGMTFIGIAQALRQMGCTRIVLYVTHGIFSRGLSVFDGLVDHIYTTNSFPQRPAEQLSVIDFQYSA